MKIKKNNLGQCHCGDVGFNVNHVLDGSDSFYCNCSFCSRRNMLSVSVPKETFELLSDPTKLSCYQWNSQTAEHYFCKQCGVHTHYVRRSNPNQMGVNVRCLNDATRESINITDIKSVDGAGHHHLV